MIHRGEAEAQVNPGRVGLYIALFPQLIAGPIVRYREIAAALKERTSRLEDVAEGAPRFIIGLAKKVLVARAVKEVSADLVPATFSALLTSSLTAISITEGN